jgi:DNA-binding protein YbaB
VLCVEELCVALGRLFEPYVVQVLEPVLLKAFSDAAQEVRDAAHDASKVVMANLSGPGVSMILPKLLGGIASDQWRTKHAAISMLGAVAFCAPKQLSSSLPQVMPRLIEAFADTHPKIRQAGLAAIKEVTSVIRNPEIETLAPTLMAALTDPHEMTRAAVDELFRTRFVNAVDAPSLALLVPILLRGLKERSTDTKKHAALIIGNMLSMVGDAKVGAVASEEDRCC